MDQDSLMPQPIERDPITQEPTHNTTFKKHKHNDDHQEGQLKITDV